MVNLSQRKQEYTIDKRQSPDTEKKNWTDTYKRMILEIL